MAQPKKSPWKKESPVEVLAIAKKGQVFQSHENGVILKLALGHRMLDRLKKALERESLRSKSA